MVHNLLLDHNLLCMIHFKESFKGSEAGSEPETKYMQNLIDELLKVGF